MKVAINTEHCASGIQKGSSITPSKTGAATLRAMWIKADKATGTISFMATDASTEFVGTYPAEVTEDGFTGVNSKSITDLIRSLPSGITKLETEEDGQILTIRQGKKFYKLPTIASTWFQPFASFPDTPSVTWSGEILCDIIEKVQFCIDDDEESALGCLFINPKEQGQIEFCGLDGNKFALYTIINDELYNLIPKQGLLIQKRYILDIKKLISGNDIEINISDKRLFIRDDEAKYTLSIPLVQYQYPNYSVFLDRFNVDNISNLSLDRAEFAAALNRIMIFNTKDDNCVYISISDGNVRVSCLDKKTGSGVEDIVATTSCSVGRVAFITKDLLEVIQKFSSDDMKIEIVSADGPCSFKTNDCKNYVVIAMPMRVVDEPVYEEEEA